MRNEITYPFLNFNGATVEVWQFIGFFHPTLYSGCNNLSILGSNLIHVPLVKGVIGLHVPSYFIPSYTIINDA